MERGVGHLRSHPQKKRKQEQRLESAQAKAKRIIAKELQQQGWQEADLLSRRKQSPLKLELAARLRRETTLSIKAIAARLQLGSSKAANRSLHNHMRRAQRALRVRRNRGYGDQS